MPWSAKRVEKITGLFPVKHGPNDWDLVGHDAIVVCSVRRGGREDDAKCLEELTRVNYDRVKMIVFRKQGWKCAVCGRIKPLQGDHIKLRSHGRDDREENLRGVCAGCHGTKHGQ